MGRLLLIRHVESEYGETSSEGDRDIPPSPKGKGEADDVVASLGGQPIEYVISSDLERAMIISRKLAAETGAKLMTSPMLRSWHIGSMAGRKAAENEKALKFYKAHPNQKIPGGESYSQWIKRWIGEALPALQMACDATDGIVAAVTHNQEIVCALEALNGKKQKMVPTASVWEVKDGKIGEWSPESKVSKESAGYMEFEGAEQDSDCEIVEGEVSRELGCCNLFAKTSIKRFSCGTCTHVG